MSIKFSNIAIGLLCIIAACAIGFVLPSLAMLLWLMTVVMGVWVTLTMIILAVGLTAGIMRMLVYGLRKIYPQLDF